MSGVGRNTRQPVETPQPAIPEAGPEPAVVQDGPKTLPASAHPPESPRQTRRNRRPEEGPARAIAIDRRIARMPLKARSTYRRAVGGRSPRAGIKAMCLECVGYVRAEVTACTALACPLFPYRPFQEKRTT